MPNGSTASGKAFVDTNVFAYAHDLRQPEKRARALEIIERLSDEQRMVVSTQVLNELCAILVRGKVGGITDADDISGLVDEMEASAEIAIVTPAMTKDAAHAAYAYAMSWYDALIWAAAKAGGCALVYTEDVPGQPEIEGITYVNPFAGPA